MNFYIRNGKQFYRNQAETYQQNQSPRQKWSSVAFAYAHRQLHAIESDSALTVRMNADYEAASRLAPNGRTYTTAHALKFNSLLYEYKQSHTSNLTPFAKKSFDFSCRCQKISLSLHPKLLFKQKYLKKCFTIEERYYWHY